MQEDFADFESDATNVNQIPQSPPAQGTPRPSAQMPGSQPPPMFPQGSPQLSHMGPPQPLAGHTAVG